MAEDNLADALLVREAIRLENLPLEVYSAADGEAAISFITTAENDPDAPSPDVVLLDLNLPKVDGFEILRRIRTSKKYGVIPVIVMTSSDSSSDRNEGNRLGASYFRKPPSYEDFLKLGAKIRQVLEESGLLAGEHGA